MTRKKPDMLRGWNLTWSMFSILLEKGASSVVLDRSSGLATLSINKLKVREWDLYVTDPHMMIEKITKFLEATW